MSQSRIRSDDPVTWTQHRRRSQGGTDCRRLPVWRSQRRLVIRLQSSSTDCPFLTIAADQKTSCDFVTPVAVGNGNRCHPTSDVASLVHQGGTGCRRLPVWRSQRRLVIRLQSRSTDCPFRVIAADQQASCDFVTPVAVTNGNRCHPTSGVASLVHRGGTGCRRLPV